MLIHKHGTAFKRPYVEEVLSLLLTLVVIGILYMYNLGGWLIDDDEGSFLYQAWRISEGERPYRDFFSSLMPVFLYTAASLVKMSGRAIATIRAVCVIWTLAGASLVFLLARRFLPLKDARLATLAFLLHPQVFRYGRALYVEPFMLFFEILGLYLFFRGWKPRNAPVLGAAGLSFAVSTLYKPLGIMPWGGCLLWILVDAWRSRVGWSALKWAMAFAVPFLLALGLSILAFASWEPAFYASAIGSHRAQGAGFSPGTTLLRWVALVVQYMLAYAPLLAFVMPVAWAGWVNRKRVPLSWQILTVAGFLLLSRRLFTRHLMYLIPSLVILFLLSLKPLRARREHLSLFRAALIAILLPWVVYDARLAIRTENDTASIVEIIDRQVEEGHCLLSDYQELNFHAARASTYLGAEISQAMIEDGKITGAKLIDDIERYPVTMVIIDVSPRTAHQLVNLPDYEQFHAYLEEQFTLLGQFRRGDQLLELYTR